MRVIICDDDMTDLNYYTKRLNELQTSIEVPISITKYLSATELLFELSEPKDFPSIIYLDINMPDISGIEVANKLRNRGYQGEIIFLTKSEEYWKPAFDVHAYHYVVKDDCTDKKFKEIFVTAVQKKYDSDEELVLFKNSIDSISVAIKNIQYFEVIDHVVTVHYSTGKFEFYSTLSKIEESFSGRGFLRVHSGYFVYIPYIIKNAKKISPYRQISLNNGGQIPIGRTYAIRVKETFENQIKKD